MSNFQNATFSSTNQFIEIIQSPFSFPATNHFTRIIKVSTSFFLQAITSSEFFVADQYFMHICMEADRYILNCPKSSSLHRNQSTGHSKMHLVSHSQARPNCDSVCLQCCDFVTQIFINVSPGERFVKL